MARRPAGVVTGFSSAHIAEAIEHEDRRASFWGASRHRPAGVPFEFGAVALWRGLLSVDEAEADRFARWAGITYKYNGGDYAADDALTVTVNEARTGVSITD